MRSYCVLSFWKKIGLNNSFRQICSCFHAESGDLVFQEKLGAAGSYFASPVAVNNKIYIASRNGIGFVIEAGDKLNILAKNNLDDKIEATPAIVESKIYLRTASSLYAFGGQFRSK